MTTADKGKNTQILEFSAKFGPDKIELSFRLIWISGKIFLTLTHPPVHNYFARSNKAESADLLSSFHCTLFK
jgi:hypothetical protein